MRKRFWMLAGSVLAGALVASGCGSTTDPGDDPGTQPTAFNWSGTWSGTMQDASAGPGTLAFSLLQSGSNVSSTGAVTLTFGGLAFSGSATGTVTETQLTLSVVATQPFACSLAVVGTRSGNVVSGTYTPALCPTDARGTFRVTKQ
jgi:hypothetical protein